MADHSISSRTSTRAVPDYPLDDQLKLGADQLKLLLEPTRMEIIDLLTERAATTSQLADAIAKPKGTVGHHCKALEKAGLIHVVRTAKVRAVEARYYGRTARLFLLHSFDEAGISLGTWLDQSYAELIEAGDGPKVEGQVHLSSARYARVSSERAEEWERRLAQLVDEFADQSRDGEVTYGLLVGLFATDRKRLDD